jgi:hypothetical protein
MIMKLVYHSAQQKATLSATSPACPDYQSAGSNQEEAR